MNRNTEPIMSTPIEQTMMALGNSDQPLLNTRLTELANLGSVELKGFRDSWATIAATRRRQIIQRLVELAEDNFALNFDAIFKHGLKDPDAEVRCQAIAGLWENEEATLISSLINLLEQDSSELVQAAAATALGKFALLAEHDKLRPDHASSLQEALLTVISDKNKPVEIRRRALEAVAPLSLSQVKTAIREAYQSDSARLRVSAIYAMGKSCDPGWLPILLKELASADAEVRYEAVGACGELEEEAAVPSLIRLVNDPDADVRMAAIQALGKIGGSAAKECLESCLNNSSAAVRQSAEQALVELADKADSLSF